jgi:thiamine biosynthesis lipoprotein ApbE
VTVVAGTNMAADAGATLAFALSGGGQEVLAKHGAHIAHMI